ncbi:MAG: VWA domain-containing protein [Candidatus Omnitrophota bacterium]|nr:MAG: VWA domain-containing protein [Candidatus Omnitrophota bacterium]
MNFVYNIFILIGIGVVLGLVSFYIIASVFKNRAMENFADKKLLSEIAAGLDIRKRRLKMALITILVLLCFLSLARPQWGFGWKKIEHRGIDVIFAIDTSKSMLAEDIKPSRLERTKLEVEYFIRNLIGDRVGITAFAGNSFMLCPITVDYNGFLINLQALDTDTVPKEGTSITSAINECIDTYERGGRKTKSVILITDGEDHEGKVIEAAKKAKDKGIKIFCIGIGSETGSTIPIVDKDGNITQLRNISGNIVRTKLDERLLKKIAFVTGGTYLRATEADFGLGRLYKDRLVKIKKEVMETKMEKRQKERFQFFLIPALIILFLEPFISERKSV